MTALQCLACGDTAHLRRHHVTASGPDGYLDPDFIALLCRWCHIEVHNAFRALQIDDPDVVPPDAHGQLVIRAVRTSVLLAFFEGAPAEVDHRVFLNDLSHALEHWAARLVTTTESVTSEATR